MNKGTDLVRYVVPAKDEHATRRGRHVRSLTIQRNVAVAAASLLAGGLLLAGLALGSSQSSTPVAVVNDSKAVERVMDLEEELIREKALTKDFEKRLAADVPRGKRDTLQCVLSKMNAPHPRNKRSKMSEVIHDHAEALITPNGHHRKAWRITHAMQEEKELVASFNACAP